MTGATLDPLSMPRVYALGLKGDSLEPDFPEGTYLVFSTEEPPEPEDLVVAYFKPGVKTPCASTQGVFRLAMAIMSGVQFPFVDAPGSELHPLVFLETTNPPRRGQFRADAFLALHKAIGTCQPDGSGLTRFGEEAAEEEKRS